MTRGLAYYDPQCYRSVGWSFWRVSICLCCCLHVPSLFWQVLLYKAHVVCSPVGSEHNWGGIVLPWLVRKSASEHNVSQLTLSQSNCSTSSQYFFRSLWCSGLLEFRMNSVRLDMSDSSLIESAKSFEVLFYYSIQNVKKCYSLNKAKPYLFFLSVPNPAPSAMTFRTAQTLTCVSLKPL